MVMKCSFCGETIPPGKGKIFVKTKGQVLNFCGSKCEKNWRLGREGKFVKWTKRAQQEKAT